MFDARGALSIFFLSSISATYPHPPSILLFTRTVLPLIAQVGALFVVLAGAVASGVHGSPNDSPNGSFNGASLARRLRACFAALVVLAVGLNAWLFDAEERNLFKARKCGGEGWVPR